MSSYFAVSLGPIPLLHRRELPNGLTVLVAPDRTAPVVSLQYWCATGSIHEGRWLGCGISHFLEHLMFKGTPRRGNSEMAQEIQGLGGHLNAYTSFDHTVYHVDLPAEKWTPALEILTDAIFHSLLPEEEFATEQEVIRREFAMGHDNPDRQLSQLLFRTAYSRHPYRFPVIGLLDLFNQLKREDLLAYYHQRYVPQNMTLIVVGDIDPESVFEWAEKNVGTLPRQPLPDLTIPSEPEQVTARHETLSFPTDLLRTALVYHIPGIEHEDTPALDLLAMLMGGGRSSRLHQQIVEKRGLAEEVSAFCYTPSQIGLWGVDARALPKQREALTEALRVEIKRVLTELVPDVEIARALRLSLVQHIRSMKTMSGKAATFGSGWLLVRDPHFHHHYLERLKLVTSADLQRVASRYLIPHRENQVEVLPQDFAIKPQTLSTDAAAKLIPEKRVLPCGSKVLTLPQASLPLISFRAIFPAGALHQPNGKSGIARLAAQLLIKGTRHRSSEQLSLDIEQMGGLLSTDAGNNSSVLSLEILESDWKRGFEIFLEILREPKVTESELETERRKQLSSLQLEKDQPMAQARNLVRAALFPGHPYQDSPLGSPEMVQSITVQDIETFWQQHFFSKETILAVAGNIPFSEWSPLVEKAFAEYQISPKPPVIAVPPLPSDLRREKSTPKQQAVIQVAFPTVSATHEDSLPLGVLDEALSDLGSRLFIRIREKLGLAYFVGTSQFLGVDTGYFTFYVGTDPKKRQLVEAELKDEIQKIAQEGITSPELERARSKILSQEQLQAQDPSSVLYCSALDELYGLGYDYRDKRRSRLANFTLDEINKIAQHYFTTTHYVTAIVSPE